MTEYDIASFTSTMDEDEAKSWLLDASDFFQDFVINSLNEGINYAKFCACYDVLDSEQEPVLRRLTYLFALVFMDLIPINATFAFSKIVRDGAVVTGSMRKYAFIQLLKQMQFDVMHNAIEVCAFFDDTYDFNGPPNDRESTATEMLFALDAIRTKADNDAKQFGNVIKFPNPYINPFQ